MNLNAPPGRPPGGGAGPGAEPASGELSAEESRRGWVASAAPEVRRRSDSVSFASDHATPADASQSRSSVGLVVENADVTAPLSTTAKAGALPTPRVLAILRSRVASTL